MPHVFTPKEIQTLAANGSVEAGDFVSKQGNAFHCKVWFKEERAGEGKKIVPDFDASLDSPPVSWCSTYSPTPSAPVNVRRAAAAV